jgi:hypothetical protein
VDGQKQATWPDELNFTRIGTFTLTAVCDNNVSTIEKFSVVRGAGGNDTDLADFSRELAEYSGQGKGSTRMPKPAITATSISDRIEEYLAIIGRAG